MRASLFTFVKPSETAKATGHSIASLLSDVTKVAPCWDGSVADGKPLDVLFLMSGAAAFCTCRDELGAAIEKAGRVVWVQDDYTCEPTPPDSTAESPYRKAFVRRHEKGSPIDYWTTVQANADRTEGSSYVPWNMVGYQPTKVRLIKDPDTLIYYGVWRKKRKPVLDRYLQCPISNTVVSSKPGNEYTQFYPLCIHRGPLKKPTFNVELGSYGAGLYVEDPASSVEFHSPARRFYEMLSARLPIAFQPESTTMLKLGGYDVTPYTVNSSLDIPKFLKNAVKFGKEQQKEWVRPYDEIIREDVRKAWAKLSLIV